MKEPMQRIVEAAGECWHEKMGKRYKCYTCAVECLTYHPGELSAFDSEHTNPSRTDLNELFRLAEKATPWEVKLTQSGEQYICYFFSTPFTCEVEVKADTPSDALVNALDQAIQEVSDAQSNRNSSIEGNL